MANIHHATAKRAASLGATVTEIGEEFGLIRDEDGAKSEANYPTAKEAVEALATDGEDFAWVEAEDEDEAEAELPSDDADAELPSDEAGEEEADEEEDTGRNRSGVMPIEYHKLYTANGGGCGDVLDATLRETFVGADGLDREAFIAFAKAAGVWSETWVTFNPGMIRMNTANRLRAKLRNDPDFVITIGEETGRFGVPHKPRKVRGKKALTKAAEAEMAKVAKED